MSTKGTKEKGWVEYKFPPTGEPIRFPTGTIYGASDGPTLMVLGGMHGSEFAGIEAAIQLFNRVDPAKLCGTLKIGMIYNLPAFQNNMGFVVPQDGINPGRTFPGSLEGSYSEVMAYYMTENFLKKADYFVELHGGDIPEALIPFVYLPITGNDEVDTKSRGLATAYNIPLIVSGNLTASPTPPRSAFTTTAMRGTPAILCESGQQGILKMEEVQTHLTGLTNVLMHLGMLPGQVVNTVKRVYSQEHIAIRSSMRGMWYPAVKLGDMVKKEDVIGHIRDYFGELLLEVKAVADGHITVIRTSPAVTLENVLIEEDRISGYEA
jgi:uncharacterized protein